MSSYPRAEKYPDLPAIYSQCSGPGALKAAEFVAEKLALKPDMRLLDIGIYRGVQSCFLAKEYGCFVVAADPWNDDFDPEGDHKPFVDHLRRNAERWGVADRVLGIALGVPELKFADASFDVAYSTTAFEMIRGMQGEEQYRRCLEEVKRVLRPGCLFGLAEPMHLPGAPSADLEPLITEGILPFKKCLASIEQTSQSFREAGFEIVEADYAPDASKWWQEYARNDAGCRRDPEGEPHMLRVDGGRWISFGYVIARTPE